MKGTKVDLFEKGKQLGSNHIQGLINLLVQITKMTFHTKSVRLNFLGSKYLCLPIITLCNDKLLGLLVAPF